MLILLCPPRLTPRSMAITTVMAISFLQRQVHGFAGCGGGAGGIENLHRNAVGFKRSQAVRLRTIENHGAELCERVVIWRSEGFRLDWLFVFSRTPQPQIIT